jgi:thiamine-phosphate pyrophosphorylase
LQSSEQAEPVFRILDANCNRLREALRVIEEYVRFVSSDPTISAELKQLRHRVRHLEQSLDRSTLLHNRDTGTDPFANKNRPEELARAGVEDVCIASWKRAQEAARVLEEYSKVADLATFSEDAKTVRFSLYALEKKVTELLNHGKA